MAHQNAEARMRRSQLISQRAASLQRSHSPVSSTGSCHGTVVSDGTTSEFFSEIEEDFANGDVWNSTGEFFFNSKNNINDKNSSKIRSTAKKHGRWEPRSFHPTPFSKSAIASAFPDFTSVAVDATEDDSVTTAEKSVSLEVARGNKPRLYTSNMASPRQSPSRHNPPSNIASNLQLNIISSTQQTTPRAPSKSKLDHQELNNADQKEQIMRSSVHKSINTSSYVSYASRSTNRERRSLKSHQPRVGDEMDNSFITEEQNVSLTIASNSTNAAPNPSKYLNRTSLPPKTIRFLDSRQTLAQDEKVLSKKEGTAVFPPETRGNAIKNTAGFTPSKRSNLGASQTPPSEPTISGNPTQTGTSFLIPWDHDTQPTTVNSKQFPIFTAQGKVQTTRLPHEFVDGIKLPHEEKHIYDMIGNMNNQNCQAQYMIGYLKRSENRSQEENSAQNSIRKRSDSGLGDSSSEISGSDAKKNLSDISRQLFQNIIQDSLIRIIEFEKLIADLQHKLDDALTSNKAFETKCRQLETKNKQLETTNNEHVTKIEAQRKAKSETSGIIRRSEAENQQLYRENQALKCDVEKLDRDVLSLEAKNRKLINKSALLSNNDNQDSEIQMLRSQNIELEAEKSALLSLNKELAAKNWARMTENQDLMAKVQELLTEKREMETEISHNKKKIENQEIASKSAETKLADMMHEKEREQSDWSAKALVYEQKIDQLNSENENLRTKLVRSEKCRKLMKTKSERILESTLEIETTRYSGTSKMSTSRKDKTTTRTFTSKSKNKKDLCNTELQVQRPSQPQNNDNLTANFGLSDVSDSESDSCTHSTQGCPLKANTNEENTIDKSTWSNFSDLLGHNFAKNMRNRAADLERVVRQQRAAEDSTQHKETGENLVEISPIEDSSHSSCSAPCAAQPTHITFTTTHREDRSETRTHRRARSLSEHNFSIASEAPQSFVRRHTMPAPDPKRKASKHAMADISIFKECEKRESCALSAGFLHAVNQTCTHKNSNCTICLGVVANKDNDKNTKTTVRIQKPVPVSERMTTPVTYVDEPTIRPSMSPGLALATVIKCLEDEIDHKWLKHQDVQKAYMSHDASLGKKARKRMADSLNTLFGEVEAKKDQLYSLYDVLEGQKAANQQMTEELLDITLTQLGIADNTWNGFGP